MLERLDVVIGGLDRPVLGQGPADINFDRLRPRRVRAGSRPSRVEAIGVERAEG